MSRICGCEVCLRLKGWREQNIPSDVIEYIMDVEMDRDYYKSILDGSWPQAEQILRDALRKFGEA